MNEQEEVKQDESKYDWAGDGVRVALGAVGFFIGLIGVSIILDKINEA